MSQGDRLREARIEAGFESQSEVAERFGWNLNTYKSNENGNAPFSFKKAKEYAKAFNVRAEWLYDASGPAGVKSPTSRPLMPGTSAGDPVSLDALREYILGRARVPSAPVGKLRNIARRIPVVGEVAAGLWRQAPVKEIDQVDEWLDMDVQGYERALLRAMRVTGPSMNLVYPDGRWVVLAFPAEAGLRIGDYVVVQRERAGLAEVTIKEFVVEEDGRIALWPRSSHPDYQAPVYLKDDPEAQDGTTIIGVVVADYGKRERPPYVFERAPS